jgi:hypothetical protein
MNLRSIIPGWNDKSWKWNGMYVDDVAPKESEIGSLVGFFRLV